MDINEELVWFNKNVEKPHVHGSKIRAKLKKWSSLSDEQKYQLKQIIPEYKKWKGLNDQLRGYSESILKKRVKLLNDYKNKIEKANFSAQSKFHPSVIEEFLYYLFRDLVSDLNEKAKEEGKKGGYESSTILLGGTTAYSNLYFAPRNLMDFTRTPSMRINMKDQDFAIYRTISIRADGEQSVINIPVVSIECKTYLDKTMLEGSIATAEKIKNGNPHCLFLVVTEWYDVSLDVDPAYSRIDQIYVLRKGKRKNKIKHPIDTGVVLDLFEFVKHHLERDWCDIEQKLIKEGKIL